MNKLLFLLNVSTIAQNFSPKDSYPNETIRDYLLRDYDKYTRPNNANSTYSGKVYPYTKVYFAFYLMWLSELDCSASNFKGNFYVIYEWDDYRLRFSTDVFEKGKKTNLVELGLKCKFSDKTQVSAADIWIPDLDIMSLTSVGESSKLHREPVTIRADGHISVFKRIFYEGYCSIRPRYFPYDFHTCYVTGFSQIGGVQFEARYPNMVIYICTLASI